ncbi:Chitinase A1 [Thalassocella blandensis]|nr:Chitinase A1 [Thalassocella blandensis]
MKKLYISAAMFFTIFFLAACERGAPEPQGSAVAASEKPRQESNSSGNFSANIIAYSMGDNIETVKSYPLQKVTHIIYSFLHLKGNSLAFDHPQSERMVRSLVALKEQYPHLKIMIALGGWGGCETCSEVFSTARGREEFIASSKEIIESFQLDGLDLDWEYPVVEGYPGHARSPDDKRNFTLLVQGLRKSLGDDTLITFAAGGYDEYLEQAIDWAEVMPAVDWVNLMSYDLVNGYSTVTGHHTPLLSGGKAIESTDNAVAFLLKQNVPANKIVIGAAFYARVWQHVTSGDNGLYQEGAKFLSSVDYKLLNTYFTENGFQQYWDDATQAPYAYSSEKQLFATYDNPKSLQAKTAYVKQKDLNGIMFWQLGSDKTNEGLIDAIYQNLSE